MAQPVATTHRVRAAAGIGLLAGFLSGLFGVGGGILIVPGLVLFMRMEQRRAHGTSLAAVVPIAAAGVIAYSIHGSVDWASAALLAPGAAAGALVGTSALHRLGQRTLRYAFAGFLVLAAVRLLVDVPKATGRAPIDVAVAAGLVAVGFIAGSLAGLLGVGGGIVIVPAMIVLFSTPDVVAKGTSLLVIIPTAVVGSVRNIARQNADLPIAGVAGMLGVASTLGGSQLAAHLNPTVSAVLFALLLMAVATRLLFRG
ncbi:MAG: sulfite exporter TauE/SafE family protein [Actinomycetota bacterium]